MSVQTPPWFRHNTGLGTPDAIDTGPKPVLGAITAGAELLVESDQLPKIRLTAHAFIRAVTSYGAFPQESDHSASAAFGWFI